MRYGFIWGVVFLVGCGGTVSSEDNRSSDRVLADEADDLCTSICQRMIDCGSSDCVCEGDVCNCTRPPTLADCQSDCGVAVQEIVAAGPECSELGLSGLRCLSQQTTCSTGNGPCAEDLEDATRCASSASDPLGCGARWGGISSTSASEDGGPPRVGSEACTEGCSGNHEYEVRCVNAEVGFECTCLMDGTAVSSFPTDSCMSTLEQCAFGGG